MTRVAVLVVSLGLLAGCAGPSTYDPAGRTEAQRQRDEDECRRRNRVPRVSRPLVFSGGRLVSYPFESVDGHGWELCVEGKGYTLSPD